MWVAFSLGSARVFASSFLAALAGASAWLSAGTLAVVSGDAHRVAALPPLSLLVLAMVVAVGAANLARLRLVDAWPLLISLLIWLPFIPGNIPNAFLLWQGPIEGIVWLVVAAGLIYTWCPALAGYPPEGGHHGLGFPAKAGHHGLLAAVAAAALALFAFTQVRDVVPNGDEPHYLAATQSLISDRDLKVENNYARGDYLRYFSGRLQPHFLQRSAAGEIYSIHSPGVSVIVLPGFLVAGYAGAVLTVIVIAGLTAALTWLVAWRLSQSAAAAWVGLTAVFATAPFLFHMFTIYPDGIGALFVMIGVWLVVRLLDNDVPSPAQLAGAGAALAVLPWLHTRFALLAVVLGAIIIGLSIRRSAKREGGPPLVVFLAVPVVAAVAWFAYFWIIWGTPSPLAPYGRDTESSWSYVGRGLTGLGFDQQFGVLTTAPVYVVAIAGMWVLLRQRARLALALLLVAVPYVIAVSTYAMWWGGTSAPGRFLGALLPLAAIPIACAWTAYPRLRMAMLLLLLTSIALVVPRLTEDGGRLVFTSRNTFDATVEWLSRTVDLARALPSVHRDGPLAALTDALPWLLAIVIVCGESIGVAMVRRSPGSAWTIVALSGAGMVMFAATLSWMFHGESPVSPGRSVLAALHGQRAWHGRFVDVSRAVSISREAFFERMSIDVTAQGDSALLRAARVPAGDYQVTAADGSPGGKVAVNVNRADPLLEAGVVPLPLHLPVGVWSLSVRTEGPAGMRIRPVRVTPAVNADGRQAIRAARYGRARVFFFDERAYPEATGFWTRGEGLATIVIDADDAARQSGLPLRFTGGSAATTIGISSGGWSQSHSLTPGERREVILPAPAGARAWVVEIHSGPGFRPFEREPGNPDVRLLAAWFEIP
jgi:hypothetical protein